MSLSDLATNLIAQAQRSGGTIVLDDTVLSADTLDAVRRAFALPAGANLSIRGVAETDIPAQPGASLVIAPASAKADLLAQTDVTIALEFTEPDATIEAAITATMPAGWTFSASFPGLDIFPFADITPDGSIFIYATTARAASPWPGQPSHTHELEQAGLHLLAEIGLDSFGLIGQLLGAIVPTTPVEFFGPFSPTAGQPLPVGRLAYAFTSGSFSVGTGDNTLSLGIPGIALEITAAAAKELQAVNLLITSDFDDDKLEVALVIPVSGDAVSLVGAPPDGASFSVEDLITSLPGGSDYASFIPAEVESVFANITLDSFAMVFDTTPKVRSLAFAIGTKNPWTIVDDVLVLDSLKLRIVSFDPAGSNWIRAFIDAEAEFLPKIFPGRFSFGVEIDKLDGPANVSSISGAYFGSVSVGTIVAGLLGSADAVPAVLQGLSFSNFGVSATRATASDPYSYSFSGSAVEVFPILDTELGARLYVNIVAAGSSHTIHLAGGLTIGEEAFALNLDLGTQGSLLTAEWQSLGDPLGIDTLSQELGLGLPTIPPGLDLGLTSAGVSYAFANQTSNTPSVLALAASSVNFGKAAFVVLGSPYSFKLDVQATLSLADLPLVGDKLPGAETLAIRDLGLVYASAAFDQAQLGQVNAALARIEGATTFVEPTLNQGFEFSAQLVLGGSTQALSLAIDSNAPPSQAGGSGSASSTALAQADTPSTSKGSATTTWIDIQRQFGIFDFNRIGIGYDEGRLTFSLDAGINLGPLTFSMDGLSIGSPIEQFDPSFDIAGLGLAYDQPPLLIEGALLKLPSSQLGPDTQFQFDGFAVVKATSFSLAAIASYAQLTSGDPSLFVFAQLEAPLGGIPAFFITGLMAGFGFNRELALPSQSEVTGFPLLVLGSPPAPGINAPAADPNKVLDILEGRAPIVAGGEKKQWIAPSPGDYWLAIGREATSFEIVKHKAVVIVGFGHDLVFALLGVSTLQLPQPSESAETYAFVQLGIEAQLEPTQGFFGLTAVLSANSYLLVPECHLTGGFAFSLWFGDNPHAGEFVVTLGGYHPAFTPPSYYPTEPRLGFSWAVSSTVSITGGAYFALTPSSVMAGGSLDAQFHDGDLRAWFTAYADVLVSWRPFFFTADIGVSIGVSYRLNLLFCHKTIEISIGASVNLWGPPTGGKVHVHLWVVSFTVSFGSDGISSADEPLQWDDFAGLLPHPSDACTVAAVDGMYKSLANTPATPSDSGKLWVVRAQKFGFFSQCAVPASSLQVGTNAPTTVATGTIDIKPMNKSGLAANHNLSIYREGETSPHDLGAWTLAPRTANLPESLWGAPPVPFTQVPSTPSAAVIPNATVGYDVVAPTPSLGPSLGLVALVNVAEEYIQPEGKSPIDAAVTPSGQFVPTVDAGSIAAINTIQSDATVQRRNQLFAVLSTAKLYSGPNGDLSAIRDGAQHLYADAPMVQN